MVHLARAIGAGEAGTARHLGVVDVEAVLASFARTGIDEHGVYLKKNEWSRIAVSPYTRYASLAEFPERLLSCAGEQDRSVFWTCLTKEWWNTAPWRESIFTKLASEGKHVDTSKFVWTR